MNLVLLEPADMAGSSTAHLSDARAEHLLKTLHVSVGQPVRVGLIDGPFGTGVVSSCDSRAVTLECAFEALPPARPAVDLLLALPRPKVMRRLWAQLAALGLGRIILTNAARVERHYFDTHLLSAASIRPLLIEGLQQARDTRLPEVSIHRQLKILVEDELNGMTGAACRVVGDPGAASSPREVIGTRPVERVLLAVGPEGGWNAFERSLLAAHGFDAIGMGARTLRTDTACIALLALVHEAIGANAAHGR